MNIDKCTNFSGRALHLCKGLFYTDEGLCPKRLYIFLMLIDAFKSFSLTFYCLYSVTHHFSVDVVIISITYLSNAREVKRQAIGRLGS